MYFNATHSPDGAAVGAGKLTGDNRSLRGSCWEHELCYNTGKILLKML
jgi:hypothetical protein